MALTGLNFNAFPKLVLGTEDRSRSFLNWENEFTLCVEMTTIKLGYDEVDHEQVPRFRGRIMALLNAIGGEGLEALTSVGFDRNAEGADFEAALTALRGIFVRDESAYVKTNKFVTAQQLAGEDEVEYYHRIEKLSRGLDYMNEETRMRLSLSLAIKGLRDLVWREQLMAETDLTWDRYCALSRARVTAKESQDFLSGVKPTSVKKEREDVCAVSIKSKKFDYSRRRKPRCVECNSDKHVIRDCPYVRCYYCNERGHIFVDCRKYMLDDNHRDSNRECSGGRHDRSDSSIKFKEVDYM